MRDYSASAASTPALIGHQGERAISAEHVAGWLGTINDEVVSAILARVPRVS